MKQLKERENISIDVPSVSGDEVDRASELVEQLIARYRLSAADTDALFNAMVTIFIRNRMVYGDAPPAVCSVSCAASGEDDGKN